MSTGQATMAPVGGKTHCATPAGALVSSGANVQSPVITRPECNRLSWLLLPSGVSLSMSASEPENGIKWQASYDLAAAQSQQRRAATPYCGSPSKTYPAHRTGSSGRDSLPNGVSTRT